MAAKTPPATVGERVRNFLGWAFVISLGIHFLILPLVIRYNPSHAEQPETEKVSVSKKVKVAVPTPPPPTPPPPPPTPQPKSTPPPKSTNPPPQAKLKVNIVHTTSNSNSGPSERSYDVKKGSESGVPQGVASAPAAVATAAATAPPPVPTPTPRPQCAVPNKDATMITPASADTPEMAKEQGISGSVEVEVDLDALGHVTGTSVIKTPSSILNSAAITAARQTTYAPQISDCKPVPGQYKFVVDFAGE